MIIDRIDLYSAAEPESLATATKFVELGLKGVTSGDSYILDKSWGLDAGEIIGNTYGGYGTDSYRRLFLEDREIVLKISLNPQVSSGETFSGLRDQLYKLIAATRTGLTEIQLMNGGVEQAFIQGQITKFESNAFTLDPVVQITITCDYPLFRSPGYTVLDLTSPQVDMPSYSWVDDISTAPHGFKLVLDYETDMGSAPADGLFIMPEWGDSNKRFWVAGPIEYESGCQIELSSEEDDRYLRITGLAAGDHNILDQIRRDQTEVGGFDLWPMMFPGTTNIGIRRQISPVVNMTNTFLKWNSISYRNHFWGV